MSKQMILVLSLFIIGIVLAQDYDGGFGGDDGGEFGGEGDGDGFSGGEGGGGDYEGDGGDGGDYAAPKEDGDDDAAAAAAASAPKILKLLPRHRRSVPLQVDASSKVLSRVRRGHHGHGVVGPVYTYQKTDHHANFKWGVKHKVGSKFAHGK